MMVKTNPGDEYNAMERCGNMTIKEIEHEKITSKNIGARQYKGVAKQRLDETIPVTSDAINTNSNQVPTISRDMRNECDIMTYRGGLLIEGWAP